MEWVRYPQQRPRLELLRLVHHLKYIHIRVILTPDYFQITSIEHQLRKKDCRFTPANHTRNRRLNQSSARRLRACALGWGRRSYLRKESFCRALAARRNCISHPVDSPSPLLARYSRETERDRERKRDRERSRSFYYISSGAQAYSQRDRELKGWKPPYTLPPRRRVCVRSRFSFGPRDKARGFAARRGTSGFACVGRQQRAAGQREQEKERERGGELWNGNPVSLGADAR